MKRNISRQAEIVYALAMQGVPRERLATATTLSEATIDRIVRLAESRLRTAPE